MKKITAILGMLMFLVLLFVASNTVFGSEIVTLNPNGVGDETNINSEVPTNEAHWVCVADAGATMRVVVNGGLWQDFNRDFYKLENFSGWGDIDYIKVTCKDTKNAQPGDNTGHLRISLKSGGSINETETIYINKYASGYCTRTHDFYIDPADGNPWEWSDITDLQAGISFLYGVGRGGIAGQVFVTIYASGNTIVTGNATSVEGTTANLGFISYSDSSVTVGAWVGTSLPIDSGNFDFNFTGASVSGTPYIGNISATGLSPGQHYWYRTWWKNATLFSNATNINTLMMKPLAPTNLSFSYNTTMVNLSWDNGTGMNKSVVVVQLGGYPKNPGDGTVIHNGTTNLTIDIGFASWTSRFYRIWSYTEWGVFSRFSDGFIQNNTQVAIFNVLFPDFLKVGQYIDARGMVMDGSGNAIEGYVSETNIRYAGNDSLAIGPAYWNCSNGNYECTIPTTAIPPGEYDIVVEFVNSIGDNFTFRRTLYLSITPLGGTYSDAILHISWYNTNFGLGLVDETLQLFVNGIRRISMTYYTYIGENISIQVKDYYNTTLYYGNFTMVNAYDSIDMGLTFHEYDFSNTRTEYYMVGFLRQGATRWYEKVVPSHGQKGFMIPTGNYTIHVYNADLSISVTWAETVNRSRGYLIQGDEITLIIQGISVVGDDILEIRHTLRDALTPDVKVYCRNPPMVTSLYDMEGMILGRNFTKICPDLITIATTKNDTYGQSIRSVPWIPSNDTVLNGTIIVRRDTLYISGNTSVLYVNITYTDNGTLRSNTTYIPAKVDLFGENVTINSSCSIAVRREIKYRQIRRFDWGHWAWNGTYVMSEEIINPMKTPLYDVYVIIVLAPNSNPNLDSFIVRDYGNNGSIMEDGPDYVVTGSSIHFSEFNMETLQRRGIAVEYRKHFSEAYSYRYEGYYNVEVIHQEELNGLMYDAFNVNWINEESEIFRGALYIKFDFKDQLDEKRIDKSSVRIYDSGNQIEMDKRFFIPTDDFIRISAKGMGDVTPGGGRRFIVYFTTESYPGADPEEYFLGTVHLVWAGVPITWFLVIQLIGIGLIGGGVISYVYTLSKSKGEKKLRNTKIAQIIFLSGCFIFFMISALQIAGA